MVNGVDDEEFNKILGEVIEDYEETLTALAEVEQEEKYMHNIKGAKVFTHDVDEVALKQIDEMMDSPITDNAQVRIMPDVHAGKGSTIGTTIALEGNFRNWKISPSIVGVDIGCGMTAVRLDSLPVTLEELDEIIHRVVPSGFNVHETPISFLTQDEVRVMTEVSGTFSDFDRVQKSIGTLGGGNHFIELGEDTKGNHWLTVHSGSRMMGQRVAKHFQDLAVSNMEEDDVQGLIERMKAEGKHREIEQTLKARKATKPKVNRDLSYLEGADLYKYLTAVGITQKYATRNRMTMIQTICNEAGLEVTETIDSIHNFISKEEGIIRKGATSARKNELLLIPLNMRDGIAIARGKGNEDWNYSAPHGAGRKMGRSEAHRTLDFKEFKDTMSGVYSTSVVEKTLDESPMAYKDGYKVLENAKPTATVIDLITPIYNFKAK